MTPAEKKRLLWILIAIFFFFANLIVVAVLLLTGLPAKHAAPTASQAAPASER